MGLECRPVKSVSSQLSFAFASSLIKSEYPDFWSVKEEKMIKIYGFKFGSGMPKKGVKEAVKEAKRAVGGTLVAVAGDVRELAVEQFWKAETRRAL